MGSYKYLVQVGEGRQDLNGTTLSTTPIFRNYLAKDGLTAEFEGCITLYDLFERSVEKYAEQQFHGHRPIDPVTNEAGPYVWQTYREVGSIVRSIGRALGKEGCSKGSRIGIYGPNAPQWAQAMQSTSQFSGICVPIYDAYGADSVEYIITHAEMNFAFCADTKFFSLAQAIGKIAVEDCQLKGVCVWGDFSVTNKASLKELAERNIRVWSWDELVGCGAEISEEEMKPIPPLPENTCTYMYTSGTTGPPKGVVITHQAMTAAVAGLLIFARSCQQISIDGEIHLSFLTLAHIYGRLVEETLLATGGRIGYWQGDINKLQDDMAELQPTIFCGVPRVWERVYDKVMKRLDSLGSVARCIYERAVEWKYSYMRAGYKTSECSPLLDSILFKTLIQRRLGGQIQFVVSGAAPLAPHLEKFMRVALGAHAGQGYGLTETLGMGCICVPDEQDMFGMVGPVMPGLEVRLESVPEMGYDANGDIPRGELCFRGLALFSGYFKNKEAYDKVVDSDGFFHTGDIAELHSSGALKIVDRKKNIFKLSQGEYVAVERIECALQSAQAVDQIWVYGNSMESSLVAIVVPNLATICTKLDLTPRPSLVEVCSMRKARALVLEELTELGKQAKLKGFERVKAVFLSSEEFSIANNLFTPSYKLKRHALLKNFQKEIDDMYTELRAKGR